MDSRNACPSRARIGLEMRFVAACLPYRAVTSVPISTITFWRHNGIYRLFTDNLPSPRMSLARACACICPKIRRPHRANRLIPHALR